MLLPFVLPQWCFGCTCYDLDSVKIRIRSILIDMKRILLRMKKKMTIFLPFSMFSQYCRIWSIIGCNEFTSNRAELLQKNGPRLPNFVGHTPWMSQASFCDGSTQMWWSPLFIHVMQSVIGHLCVNISMSKSVFDDRRNTSLLMPELQ